MNIMKRVIFVISILIMVIINGCATTGGGGISSGVRTYCQTQTARFINKNIDPDEIIIKDVSSLNYSGVYNHYKWTAIIPNGDTYKCKGYSGDENSYCTKLKKEKTNKTK